MLVKITMVNIPSLIAKVCSAETPNNHMQDGAGRVWSSASA